MNDGGAIAAALLESDEINPKSFAMRTRSLYDDAIQDAKAAFVAACEAGRVHSARTADEVAHEVAQDACAEYGLGDNDDFDTVVTEVFKLAAETFPGNW